MTITIRRASPADADILSSIAFSAKKHWGYPDAWMEEWREEFNFPPAYFADHENWVAMENNSAIAFYTLQERDGEGWIENLWVTPGRIGKGVGKQLFDHAFSRCREMGYKKLRLESDPHAAGFYERMGLRQTGGRRADMDGQPRIIPLMEIDL